MDKAYNYKRISDKEYKKALFQLRGQMNDVLQAFDMYEHKSYISPALEELVLLSEQFGMRVRGKNQMIMRRVR